MQGFEISPSEIEQSETRSDTLKPLLIEEGDLLLVRHHPSHLLRGEVRTGLFSRLILSILVHELITSYQWIVLPLHYAANGPSSLRDTGKNNSQHVKYPFIVPNGSVKVKDFRSVHAISFLMPSWREEEEEEDERYFSDGL